MLLTNQRVILFISKILESRVQDFEIGIKFEMSVIKQAMHRFHGSRSLHLQSISFPLLKNWDTRIVYKGGPLTRNIFFIIGRLETWKMEPLILLHFIQSLMWLLYYHPYASNHTHYCFFKCRLKSSPLVSDWLIILRELLSNLKS